MDKPTRRYGTYLTPNAVLDYLLGEGLTIPVGESKKIVSQFGIRDKLETSLQGLMKGVTSKKTDVWIFRLPFLGIFANMKPRKVRGYLQPHAGQYSIVIFALPGATEQEIKGVLAHEAGHVKQLEEIGESIYNWSELKQELDALNRATPIAQRWGVAKEMVQAHGFLGKGF